MKLDLEKLDPKPLILAGLVGSSFMLSGCLAAAAGAGYVAGEEISEDDDDFDPLDEVDE
ncbi:MAG: hypothetical protein RIB03_01990 [Henriciella sp.]|uniref:hypothetical protein n=1 Tax=Henriciella sp. TaxID=1968823 RepID=UPI00260E61CA|nr:hypothetical protein [Henriciella sp.]